jgi:tight adherence protein C
MGDGMILMIATFGAMTSLILLIGLFVVKGRTPVEARLEGLAVPARRGADVRGSGETASSRPAPRPAAAANEEEKKSLGDRLVQAGLYKRNSVGFYVATQVILFVLPVAGSIAASSAGVITMRQALFLGAITGILGILVPSFWLDAQKRKRQTQLRRALPDALDVIVVCVEAGLSLPAAFARVSNELRTAHPMLAAEMIIVQREIQMGCSTGEALRRFADRFDLEELRSMSSVILQAEKFGASIVQALRVHAESLRIKRYQRAEERAQQAAVKLLIPTVFFIFPSLFVVLLGPAIFDIYELVIKRFANIGV